MEDTNEKEKKGTTVYLDQEAYTIIINKQTEIFNKTNKRMSIQDLVSNFVKKGAKLNDIELKNLIYKDVIKILEPLEHKEYEGNSHHLTQEIVEKLSHTISEISTNQGVK